MPQNTRKRSLTWQRGEDDCTVLAHTTRWFVILCWIRWLGYGRLLRVPAQSPRLSTRMSACTSLAAEEEDEFRLLPFLFRDVLVSFSHPDTMPLSRMNLLSVEGFGCLVSLVR